MYGPTIFRHGRRVLVPMNRVSNIGGRCEGGTPILGGVRICVSTKFAALSLEWPSCHLYLEVQIGRTALEDRLSITP